jgi:hypothetical protein
MNRYWCEPLSKYENYLLPWALNTHGPEKSQPGLNPCLYPTAGAQKENLFTPEVQNIFIWNKC